MCHPRDGAQGAPTANVRSSGMVSRMAALSIAALIVRRNLVSKGLAIEALSTRATDEVGGGGKGHDQYKCFHGQRQSCTASTSQMIAPLIAPQAARGHSPWVTKA